MKEANDGGMKMLRRKDQGRKMHTSQRKGVV